MLLFKNYTGININAYIGLFGKKMRKSFRSTTGGYFVSYPSTFPHSFNRALAQDHRGCENVEGREVMKKNYRTVDLNKGLPGRPAVHGICNGRGEGRNKTAISMDLSERDEFL